MEEWKKVNKPWYWNLNVIYKFYPSIYTHFIPRLVQGLFTKGDTGDR